MLNGSKYKGFRLARRLVGLVLALLVIGYLVKEGPPVSWDGDSGDTPADSVAEDAHDTAAAQDAADYTETAAPCQNVHEAPTLRIPVENVESEDLQDTFDDPRGSERMHEAIDILAARGTPVVAAEDGTIARLYESVHGGYSIYQFNCDSSRVYYYAHLDRYAAGLTAGDTVTSGERLGRVGTSGNAPEDTPHLHFAVWEVHEPENFWSGSALNPYLLLTPDSLN